MVFFDDNIVYDWLARFVRKGFPSSAFFFRARRRLWRSLGLGNSFEGDNLTAINDLWEQLPSELRELADAQLTVDAPPLAWLELDLDIRLHYAKGLIVLTARRLLAVETATGATPVRSWPLDTISGLRTKDFGSVGTLELLGPPSCCAIGAIPWVGCRRPTGLPIASSVFGRLNHRKVNRTGRLRPGFARVAGRFWRPSKGHALIAKRPKTTPPPVHSPG